VAEQNLDIVIRVRGGTVAASEINQVGGAVKGVGDTSETTEKKTSGLKSSLLGLATGIGVYKGYQFVKGAISTTEDLTKATMGLQRVTGLDAQTASGWIGIAKERGISTTQLNQGFITLSRQMQAAASGTKSSAEAFKALGVSQDQVKKMNTPQAINAISAAFEKMPPGAQRSTLASKLFGRSAQALLPLLAQGSKGLNDQVDAMGRHIGMTNNDMKSSLALVKQQREFEATMLGLKVAIATALLPVLQQLSQILLPITQAFTKAMQSSLAFRIAVIGLSAALVVFVGLLAAVNLLALPLTGTVAIIIAVVAAIIGLGAAFVVAYNKVKWFRDGVNAVFDFLKQHWKLFLAALPLIGPIALLIISNFNKIKSVASAVFSFMVGAVKGAVSVIKSLGSILGQVAGTISGVFTTAWNGVKTAVGEVVSALNTMVSLIGKVTSVPGKIANFITSHIPFGQHGLTMRSPGLAVVGEAGPELVALPGGAQVIPNHVAFGGGGGGSANIHTHVYLNDREIAHAMGNYVAGRQASR
jgi:hypothetical protein